MEKQKILIVEDSAPNRMLLSQILQMNKYAVVEAVNGREGLEVAKIENPDLIVLDMQMPILDGIGFMQNYREFQQDAPIIVLSALTEQLPAAQAYRYGALDIIRKPFDQAIMLFKIQKILTRFSIGQKEKQFSKAS